MMIEILIGGQKATVDANGWKCNNPIIQDTLNQIVGIKAVNMQRDYVPNVVKAMAYAAENELGAKIVKTTFDDNKSKTSEMVY